MDVNPFSQLFSTSEDLREAAEIARRQTLYTSDLLTRIFLFTNIKEQSHRGGGEQWPVAHVIRLPQLCLDEQLNDGRGLLREDNIAQGLAERLQLTSLSTHLVSFQSPLGNGLYSKEMALESSLIEYLAHSYARAGKEMTEHEGIDMSRLINKCKELIGQMAGPVSLVHQQRGFKGTLADLLIQTLCGKTEFPLEFFSMVAGCVVDEQSLQSLFNSALERVFDGHQSTASLSAQTRSLYFDFMHFFSSTSSLARLLTDSGHWMPSALSVRNGKSFESTLLGKLLSPSTVALSFITPAECFPADRFLTQMEVEATSSDLHWQLTSMMDQTEQVFSNLLRSDSEVKRAVVTWLVDCFEANASRAQMAFRLRSGVEAMLLASDGFFLNLNWVLLRLCKPFMVASGGKALSRLTSIDPTYCGGWSPEECAAGDSFGPLVNFSKESKLVPCESSQCSEGSIVREMPDFLFVTHCFFLTHKSLILGMTQVVHLLEDLHRAFARAQEAVRQMGLSLTNQTHPIIQQCLLIQSQLLGLRTHAMHPDLLDLALSFHASTAHWLVNLTTPPSSSSQPHSTQSKLKDFPECVVDNMANFAMFLRHSDADTLSLSSHLHTYFITFCTIFMGSSQLVHNPHIRAKLTQLVLLIAGVGNSAHHQQRGLLPSYSESQREVFGNHQVATDHLLPSLMSIFVDIEFTGESMEFEDKFQYRLPMYALLEFLWPIPSYRPCIERLASQATESLVLQEAPLFLRFINMIVNDATVQLDEGLENLAKVKELEELIASDDGAGLSEQEKKDNQLKLTEARMLARNRNLLAQKTMSALSMITEDTWKPFVVESLVQRMANMLNYVLSLLVGPKSRQFKVKNARQLNFKPGELVVAVIKVYVNLGREINFCEALLKDGRSFSMGLFAQARRVIMVLDNPSTSTQLLVAELTKVEERVAHCQIRLSKEQDAYEDAPEEFLDPVTQEIMLDPVELPTSGKIMDRANIIRHLLSDQTDPFNRAPLTADMLNPASDLRSRIEQWKREQQ